MEEARVVGYVDELRDYVVELTKKFVKIPTINPPGEYYEEFANALARELEAIGLEVELIRVPAEELNKFNVTLPRVIVVGVLKGLETRRTLILNGHYDVVPPGSGWEVDPFKPIVKNGRMYGRGVADMKGGLASMITAIKAVKEQRVKLRGDVVFVAVPDEETGGHLGAGYLVKNKLVRGDACIIGEPTGLTNIAVAEKGALWLELTIYGKASHGSLPHLGINAVEKMAKVIVSFEKLKELFKEKKSRAPFPEEVSYTTINIGGVIRGGLKINIVPDTCTCTLDVRVIPEETLDNVEVIIREFLEDMKKKDPELKYELKVLDRIEPAYVSENEEIVIVLKNSIRDVIGHEPKLSAIAAFTDMRWFKHIAPTVLYGPGELVQAHTANEHVEVDNLVTASKIYALAIMKYLKYL